jgi:rubredoxin
MIFYDNTTPCPHCHEIGGLSYNYIPESTLTYTLKDENHTEYLPVSRNYSCKNCDGEFIRLEPSDETDSSGDMDEEE